MTHFDTSLSEKDLNKIAIIDNTNPISIYLKRIGDMDFQIGDILIQKNYMPWKAKEDQDPWVVQTVSAASAAPAKFLFVYKDELGIGYIKKIKSDGSGLGSNLICLADEPLKYRKYEVDPEYAMDVVLLDTNVDILAKHKNILAHRKSVDAKNKKIAIRVRSEIEREELFNSLKIGDQIWLGSTLRDATKNLAEVVDIRKDRANKPVILFRAVQGCAPQRGFVNSTWLKVFFKQDPFSYE